MKHLKNYLAGLTDALASIANWRFGIATLLVLPSMVLVAEPAVALGPCTINWIGADGVWESAANWSETTTLANRVPNATDTVCIDDASATSALTITVSTSIAVLGIDNSEHLMLDGAFVTIEEGGEIVNRGTTTLANAYIAGSAGGQGSVFERFVNQGSLVKSGDNFTYIDSTVRVDNTGTISVTGGQLSIGQVGVWPGITYQVSAGASLSLGVNEASDFSGVQSVSGGGRVAFNGTLKPVSAPLVLNFPAGGLYPLTGVLDTTVAPITNSGVVDLVSPIIKGVGFTNTGTVRQDASSVPTLDEGAVVTNEGSWSMENAYLQGTFGGVFERFVNQGSLVKSGDNFTYIDSPVRVDNTGTISVTGGQLQILQVGVWPGITYQVSAGASLSLGVNEASDFSGVQSVSGGGRVAFNGTLKPVSAPLVLNFPAGGLYPLTGVLDTTVAPITNSGVVDLVSPIIKGVGFTNTGTVRQDASSVPTLDEGAVVTNEGSWSMENAYLQGTFGGVFERFVNQGSLVKSGDNFTYIDSPVRVDNTGTISVTGGQLQILQVGVWPGITYQVSAGASLSLGVNEASDFSGVQSVSGGGRVAFNGTLKPVSAPLVLNFPAGGLYPLTGVLDTTVAPITNSGVVDLVSPIIKGVGFTNTGTVRQDASSVPTLDEGAVVTNEGSWSMENAYLQGTFGGVFERFVNQGSLVKSGDNFTYIDSPVRVDNTGTISVTGGQLSILGDVVQVTAGSLVAGTWIATGILSLPSAGPLTTIGASATVVLDGPTGELRELASLGTNQGSFRLSGGRDFTTLGGLANTGTLRVGPQSTLSVTGDFATTGTAVFELAGTAATGLFGEIVATGAGALGGAATIVIDAGYTPSASDVFRLGTFADITSPFATVNGATPTFTANYTATQFVLNAAGSLPIAAAGADATVAEATPPLVVTLDGSGSTDVDGTITSYHWTAPAGVTLTNANTAVASYTAADDASFTATLEVCDNDAQCDTDTVNVTVTNVAPSPNGGADQAATAGSVVPITVTFTDPGGSDTHTATVNWSDGSGLVDVGGVTSGFGLSHTFTVGGTYFVSICVTDDDGGPGCDTVAVVVSSAGNLPPDAVADTGTVRRNSTANILNVLSNDTDPDFNGLTISAFDAVSTAGGAVDCSSQFWCYYTPPADFVGTDTFTYTASDGQGGVDTATVTVTVVLNQAPVAIDDTETVRRDSLPRDIYVLGNDTDADFDFLTISAFDPASVAGGTVNCSFACTYTPPVGFLGTDTFTYTVSDGRGGTDVGMVTVTVVPNTAPDAQDDNYAGNAPDAPFQIFVTGNDFDVDLDVLTVTAVSDPPRGSAVIAPDGLHVLYTPDAGVVGTDTFTYTISDGAGGTDTATVTVTVRDYADISNGVVRIGVWDRGNLNIPTGIGLTYVPTGNDSTAPGCPCEGWGAADATTGVTGYANESAGTAGIQTVSFVKTASTAVSTVLVGTKLRVTHDYHPSTDPNLYEVTVTVENVSSAPVDLRYRRVMDWDIEPTAFSEYVTIERGNAAGILFTSDDGFASANPLAGPSSLMFTGEAVDSGPSDHGALFDFGFGSLAPGTATTFRTYYGAAGTEVDALAALADVGAEAYSLGQPSTVGGPTLGTPNTFVFAFTGVGGGSAFPEAVPGGPYAVQEGHTVTLDGTGSSVPGGTIASYSWTPAGRLTGATTATPSFAAIDDETVPITLTVCDDQTPARCDTKSTTLLVTNAVPVVNAGPDVGATAGIAVAVSTSFTDAGTLDTHSATVNWGDGTAVTSIATATSPFSRSHTYAAAGTFTVTVCVTDDDGAVGCDTAVIGVVAANVAPVAVISGPVTVVEGSSIVVSGASSTDSDGTIATYAWSVSAGATLSNTSVQAPMLTGRDDASVTLTLTVTDNNGASHTVSRTVTVTNAVPVVSAGPDLGATAGVAMPLSVTFTDAGTLDTHSATIDWGDGSALFDVGAVAAGFSRSHTYAAAGTYTATVCVTDDDGGVGCDTTAAVVEAANVAPVAVISGPVTVVEGSSIVVSGASSTDSDGTIASYAWSVSAGATLSDTSVQAPTLTGVDDASVTLTLTVTDDDGAQHTAARTVTVTNANPVVNAGLDLSGTAGVAVAMSTSFTDAGTLDTHSATIDWGDGTAVLGVGAVVGGFSRSHTYPSAGTFTITACVTDNDGGVGCDAAVVTVSAAPVNVAPVAVISGPVTVVEGSSIVVSGASSTDSDGTVVSYAWSVSAGATLSNASVVAPTLTGRDDASVTLTLTVTDNNGASHTVSRTVTVTNASPVVNTGLDLAGTAGVAMPLSATFTDAGTLDTHSATIDWGDGSALFDVGAVAAGFSRSHTYAGAGTYTITACVTDDDGGVGCDSTVVVVNAPPVAVITVLSVVEGSSIVVSGASSTDPDGTVVSYAWSVTAGATLSNTSVMAPTLTGRDDATVTLTLTVTDDDGAQQTTSRTVTVTNANPVVNAGVDLSGTAGVAVAMSTSFTDAGTLDTHSATVNWGDGTAVLGVGAVVGGFSRSHTYTAAGTYTITACVTDDDGGVGCDAAVVSVAAAPVDVAPVAVISGPVTVVEGSSIVVSGASSTDSDGTVVSYAWSVSAGATLSNSSVVAPTLTGRDDASVTLTLTVTDDDGLTHATSRTVTVTNAVPVVNAGPDLGATAGVAVGVTVGFTDAGTLDTHSATVDWGDGSALFDVGAVAVGFSRSHTYAAPGSFTITACVTDDDGGVGCDTTAVVVKAPPVAVITGPVTMVEGSSIVVSGATSTDSDGAIVSYAWSVTAGATLSNASVQAPTLTGRDDASVTLTLKVTDNDGLTHTTTSSVTVTNANPVVNAGLDLVGTAGVAVAMSTSFTDAGTLDTHSATVNWGDGTAVLGVGAVVGGFSRSHTYPSAGTFTITACVTDDDGGVGCDAAVVTVSAAPVEVAPVAVISGPVTVVEGSSIVVSGATSTDSDGTVVSYAWTVSAGATLSNASVVAPTLTGRDDSTLTLTLTVTDDDGLTHTTTRTVTVTNANPVVNAGVDLAGTVGTAVAVSTSFTDAGTLDTHSATVNWGDGTAVTSIAPATSPFSRSHTYTTAGSRTVTVCVTDDNGGVGCDTTVVTVSAVVLPGLTISDTAVDEPDDGVRNRAVTVTLAGSNTLPVTVQYRTVNGTAVAGGVAPNADYVPATGTLTFAPGSGTRTQSITTVVNGDLYRELAEQFVVELHTVSSNARIDDSTATVTINDDGDICTIVGTSGADVLIGDDGPNVICALSGDDLVDGRGGNDMIFGDAGTDRITFANAPARVVVDLLAGTATGWGTDQVESFEEVVGSAFDDRLSGTEGANWMVGNSGVDTVIGRGGVDQIFGNDGNDAELNGGTGNDTILGGAGNDRLIGGDGIDTLTGSFGADTLIGNDGNDVLEGEDGNDDLAGGDGVDRLYGGVGADALAGNAGNDTMFGGGDNDTMSGGDDDDTMSGEAGVDTMNGNDGHDTMAGGDDRDVMSGGAVWDAMSGGSGNDTMDGDGGDDRMAGDDGTDNMDGGADQDNMTGGADGDTMFGGTGADTMAGNSGNDTVSGNDGPDSISGGDGNDVLHGNANDDVVAGGAGNDDVYGDGGNDELHGGSGTNHLWGGAGLDNCSFGPPDELRTGCDPF